MSSTVLLLLKNVTAISRTLNGNQFRENTMKEKLVLIASKEVALLNYLTRSLSIATLPKLLRGNKTPSKNKLREDSRMGLASETRLQCWSLGV